MKYMSVCVFVESLQSYGSGVLKTAGAQRYAMMFSLICFYLIGMPLGYFFIFKSGLNALGKRLEIECKLNRLFKIFFSSGFFISHSIVGSILICFQMIFIYNINWNKKAQEVILKVMRG